MVSGSPWSNGLADSDARNVFNPTSFKADASTDYLNPETHVVLTSLSTESDATLASSSNPSSKPHLEQSMDLINRETSTIMPYEQSPATAHSTVRSNTSSRISKTVLFGTFHSETETRWSPVPMSLYLEGTNPNIIPNTVSDITINASPVSLTLLHLQQPVIQSSLSPLHLDITVHSSVLSKTTIISTIHEGTSVQPETVTLASTWVLKAW